MNLAKMYPTTGYVVAQILLLIFLLIPGIIFFIWRVIATA